jgi:hypothetical protein
MRFVPGTIPREEEIRDQACLTGEKTGMNWERENCTEQFLIRLASESQRGRGICFHHFPGAF